jgi:heterodisulfide reductase subunit B
MKTECCGASFSITRTDIVGRLGGRILEDAVDRGAEAVIVACPMCHSNLDMRRKEIERAMGRKFAVPILYITQAIGIALGIEPKALGLQRHFVPVAVEGKSKVQQSTPLRAGAAVS